MTRWDTLPTLALKDHEARGLRGGRISVLARPNERLAAFDPPPEVATLLEGPDACPQWHCGWPAGRRVVAAPALLPGDLVFGLEVAAWGRQLSPFDRHRDLIYRADVDDEHEVALGHWQHATSLPRAHVRLHLRVRGVRLLRLREPGEETILAAGCGRAPTGVGWCWPGLWPAGERQAGPTPAEAWRRAMQTWHRDAWARNAWFEFYDVETVPAAQAEAERAGAGMAEGGVMEQEEIGGHG